MTRTADPVLTAGGGAKAAPQDPAPAPSIVGPPKPRRRWGLFAAMVLVVCLGALGGVWLLDAATTATPVVAARSTIERGSVIDRDDLVTVRVEADPALQPVAGADLESLVGQRAALDIAAGSLLTTGAVTEQSVPAEGYSLVGIGVAEAMMPGAPLMAGDRVRFVVVADPAGGPAPTVGLEPIGAVVVGTQVGSDVSVSAQTIVTVQVPADDAAQLAAIASTGKVALVLDSRDR
jgi:SAF domain